ncbi:hypothetical protein EOPP23_07500 [Endozoicomonas sp. OPT23]|uniref:hypothetical protein n=1 Tax=Endozoicomonas sp. OPT23 TaxID=2072845 RepID=UPI00129A842D|nr:hypothetical protein [Endozoicomonas sp. OPT23]MRI32828.1 hypothetical protein [Endozoicomonas sp. OPT23]
MSSLALSDAVLALASAFAVFLMSQQKSFAVVHRTASKGALLGFLLMAGAGVTGTLNFGFSEAWFEVYRFLNNAATFMAPPLIGTAMILVLTGNQWSKPAWGRLVIAICLAFEVCRWYGLGDLYRDLQIAGFLAIIMLLLLKAQIEPGPKAMVIAAFVSYFVGALVIGNEGTLAGYLRLNLFRYLIALGNLLLGSGLFMLLKSQNKYTEQTSA